MVLNAETYFLVANLVEGIQQTFTDPMLWPMSESARIEFMKGMWMAARNIKETRCWRRLAPKRRAITGHVDR